MQSARELSFFIRVEQTTNVSQVQWASNSTERVDLLPGNVGRRGDKISTETGKENATRNV